MNSTIRICWIKWSGRRESNSQLSAWEGKYSALYFQHLQNRSRKICMHAAHTVHALPDLRVAAGRLRDGVSWSDGTEHSSGSSEWLVGMRWVKDVVAPRISSIVIHFGFSWSIILMSRFTFPTTAHLNSKARAEPLAMRLRPQPSWRTTSQSTVALRKLPMVSFAAQFPAFTLTVRRIWSATAGWPSQATRVSLVILVIALQATTFSTAQIRRFVRRGWMWLTSACDNGFEAGLISISQSTIWPTRIFGNSELSGVPS